MSKNSAKNNYQNLVSWMTHNKIQRKEKSEENDSEEYKVKFKKFK